MTFLHAGFLWLLPCIALVWLLPRRSVPLGHGLLRSLVFTALILGLARPVVIREAWTDHQVVILDRTASVAHPGDAAVVQKFNVSLPVALYDLAALELIDLRLPDHVTSGEAGFYLPSNVAYYAPEPLPWKRSDLCRLWTECESWT